MTESPRSPAADAFWRRAAVLGDDRPGFLLDSGLGAGGLGRRSWFGTDPSALITGRRRRGDRAPEMDFELTTWREPGGGERRAPTVRRFAGDPFAVLRELSARYFPRGGAAGRLEAGLVGYFGYETAHVVERLPDTGADDLGLPDLAFLVCEDIATCDHGEPGAPAAVAPPAPAAGEPGPDVRAHFDRAAYMAAVETCRGHIRRGDVFEVCLTHRLEMDLPGSPWELYAALREINPAPFASFLQFPGFAVVGASPERFLRLDADRTVESRPIKGTRPRGATPAADAAIAAGLAASEKDLAENVMIVDLVRNDLGRVCEIGSVHVPELQVVETYATVHQLVSTVRGRLKPQHDAFDLVRACFPGGSMTGAPKIEAMKIIDRLEPVVRGVYSGAVGFIDAGGAMDLGMVIRTLVCRDGRATFGVGGAVVADSDPGAEYDETLDKARALIAAVRGLAARRAP
ncbi:aminodeoxychorismate synthase component I [bacterium]|nr:aminodeoxychorismate synthase component I [bacterium]